MDDSGIEAMRQDAIRRLSVALDIPEEVITDNEGYHWKYGHLEQGE